MPNKKDKISQFTQKSLKFNYYVNLFLNSPLKDDHWLWTTTGGKAKNIKNKDESLISPPIPTIG